MFFTGPISFSLLYTKYMASKGRRITWKKTFLYFSKVLTRNISDHKEK